MAMYIVAPAINFSTWTQEDHEILTRKLKISVERKWSLFQTNRLVDAHTSEDIAQDIITKAWEKWAFTGDTVTFPILHGRVLRRVIEHVRKQDRHLRVLRTTINSQLGFLAS